MSFFNWLLEPIRETHRLAPIEGDDRAPGFGQSPAIAEGAFATLERQRLAALKHRSRSFVVGVPVLLLLTAATYFVCRWFGVEAGDAIAWTVVALVVGAWLLRALAGIGIWIFRKTAKHEVLSALAVKKGLQYNMKGPDRALIRPFNEQELFGTISNGGESEDLFSGRIEDVDFVLFEALRETISKTKNGTSTTTVFHGLCLRLSFPKRFSGTTRVLSDAGVFNKLYEGGSRLQRVKLEDERFEKLFEVVSTDQVEARYLLTPALMERLLEAQQVLGKRTLLRAGFQERHMLLTLDTRKNRSLWQRHADSLNQLHHFEIKDPKQPVEEMALVRHFEQELAVCRDIVKTLKLNMKTRI